MISLNRCKIFFLFIVIWIVLGCNPFSPELADGDINAGLIITAQKTPRDVLINFSFAYNFQDSLVYSDLLDSSFIFLSKDFSTDPVTDLKWGRDEDIRKTNKMFKFFQTLDLEWGRYEYEGYTDDDSLFYEISTSFQLTIDGAKEYSTITGIALFYFIKKTSGIWKITRWEDKSDI